MALIKCPECGKDISDKAASCPNCGCPIEKRQEERRIVTFDEAFDSNLISKINPGAAKKAKMMIGPNESVLFASNLNISTIPVSGKLSDSFFGGKKVSGVFIITDKRVLFVQSTLGIGDTKQILKENITSVDTKASLMNCPVRIKGLTEMFVVDCNKNVQSKIMNALNNM